MASNWLATFASHDTSGTLFMNTLGIKMDPSSGDGLSANDLATEINTWLGTTYKALLYSGYTFDTITVRKMPEPTTEEGVHAVGAVGTSSLTKVMPKEISCTLAWKTDHPGRSGRGHIALPGPYSNAVLSGTGDNYDLTQSFFTSSVAAFFSALDAGHDWGVGGLDGHLSHIVYSRKDNAGYDVKARIARAGVRWTERRQTAP